jgi:hypothetical protein
LAEVLERLFELAPGLSQLGTVCRGGRRADAEIGLEEWACGVEGGEHVAVALLVRVPGGFIADVRLHLEEGIFIVL